MTTAAAQRFCFRCLGPIGDDKMLTAIYCSRKCRQAAANAAYEERNKRDPATFRPRRAQRDAMGPAHLRAVPCGPVRTTAAQLDAAIARAHAAAARDRASLAVEEAAKARYLATLDGAIARARATTASSE